MANRVNLGYVCIDEVNAEDNVVRMLTKSEKGDSLFRGQYLDLDSSNGKRYLGKIIKGPFYLPESGSSLSIIHTKTTVEGDILTQIPPYFVACYIEIIGEKWEGEIVAVYTRPLPKTPANPTSEDELKKIIGIGGDIYLGNLYGYDGISIKLKSDEKNVLPRNFVLCGTVGSGKSNTAQVIMEEAIKAKEKLAVIVVDVEGEYTKMDEPSGRKIEIELLKKFGLEPEGVKDLKVYYPNGSSKPKEVKNPQIFCIKESKLDLRLLLNFLPDLSPKMKAVFADIVDWFKEKHGIDYDWSLEGIYRYCLGEKDARDKATKEALRWRLRSIMKLGIFQNVAGGYSESELDAVLGGKRPSKKEIVSEISMKELLKPGRISVIDVSDTNSDAVNNIIIAWLLEEVFKEKVEKGNETHTLLIIEEAHTFFSSGEMDAALEKIRTVARRGRKRWFCLGFVTQQPAHLPQEVFELCNTRIVHQVQSVDNIQVIKKSTGGGVRDEIWNTVLNLRRGQALIISPQFNHPVITNIRPAQSERKFTT